MEQNFGNRFLAPMFFSAAFLFYYYKKFIALFLFFFLSIFFSRNMFIDSVNSLVFSGQDNIYYISRDLSKIHGKMLVTEAGRLAYYSDWLVHDSWGLNTPVFAHQLVTVDDVANGDYDLVVGHCDLALLADGADLKPNGNRSWGNQCKVLVSAIKREGGTVMLVPYNNHAGDVRKILKNYLGFQTAQPSEICKRYDIYAVSRQYEKAAQLIDILARYDAIVYSQAWKKSGEYALRDDLLCAPSETAFR